MLQVSRLFIYPIKSLAGISVGSAVVEKKGFRHDRRFMLVDPNNRFLTLREFPQLARLQPELHDEGMSIVAMDSERDHLLIPFNSPPGGKQKVVIWNAEVEAVSLSETIDTWFSDYLGTAVRLVHMPENSMRPVDTTSGFRPEGKWVSFADAYPFMIMGEASIDDLNQRFEGNQEFSIHRFRPNIVFSGGRPNQEDYIENFSINGVSFTGLENCARCTIPNVDPKTGKVDENTEPIATLSKYRLQNRKINFGRNLVHSGTGIVRVGDQIELK